MVPKQDIYWMEPNRTLVFGRIDNTPEPSIMMHDHPTFPRSLLKTISNRFFFLVPNTFD